MTAITLMPRIHLVGAGTLGVDFSRPFDGNIYVVDGRSEWAIIDMGREPGSDRVIENIRDLVTVAGLNLGKPATLIIADASPVGEKRRSAICAAFPGIRVRNVAVECATGPDLLEPTIELGGRRITVLPPGEQAKRGGCRLLSEGGNVGGKMPLVFASTADT